MPEGDKCDDLALPQTAKQAYVANIGRGYENNVKEAKNSPFKKCCHGPIGVSLSFQEPIRNNFSVNLRTAHSKAF